MIYFTSDLHFGHEKEFLWGPRGFSSSEEHDTAIIKNWNDVVGIDDDVYVLGDLMLGDNEEGIKKIKSLNGKIHVILGNHDTDTRIELYNNCSNIIEISYATVVKYKKYKFYLSHYPTITSNFDENKPLKTRVISLCGHTHCKNKFQDIDKGLIYHCELDAHNCRPINIEDIIEDIKNIYKGE